MLEYTFALGHLCFKRPVHRGYMRLSTSILGHFSEKCALGQIYLI